MEEYWWLCYNKRLEATILKEKMWGVVSLRMEVIDDRLRCCAKVAPPASPNIRTDERFLELCVRSRPPSSCTAFIASPRCILSCEEGSVLAVVIRS